MNACKNCNKETDNDRNVRLHEDDGFSSYSYSATLCNDCRNDSFVNSYGFEFLKIDNKIYIQHPYNGSFEMATSQKDIDRAFNPEKFAFEDWLRKV